MPWIKIKGDGPPRFDTEQQMREYKNSAKKWAQEGPAIRLWVKSAPSEEPDQEYRSTLSPGSGFVRSPDDRAARR